MKQAGSLRTLSCVCALSLGVLVSGCITTPPVGGAAYTTENLIKNPSNEAVGDEGQVPEWTQVYGDQWTQRFKDPIAQSGNAYFFAGKTGFAELRQDVDLGAHKTSSRRFHFVGFVRSYVEGDLARLVLEFRNADEIVKTYDRGETFHPDNWHRIEFAGVIPKQADYVRIRMVSRREKGKNNDSYFDNLSLRLFN